LKQKERNGDAFRDPELSCDRRWRKSGFPVHRDMKHDQAGQQPGKGMADTSPMEPAASAEVEIPGSAHSAACVRDDHLHHSVIMIPNQEK
jgi:hypothetical protein